MIMNEPPWHRDVRGAAILASITWLAASHYTPFDGAIEAPIQPPLRG
jgi:hypothetical protein